jgi:hypothetical protein
VRSSSSNVIDDAGTPSRRNATLNANHLDLGMMEAIF